MLQSGKHAAPAMLQAFVVLPLGLFNGFCCPAVFMRYDDLLGKRHFAAALHRGEHDGNPLLCIAKLRQCKRKHQQMGGRDELESIGRGNIVVHYETTGVKKCMPRIESVATAVPPHEVSTEASMQLARHFFQDAFPDIDRLLNVFAHSHIEKRHFCMPLDWFSSDQPFAEKNRLYIQHAEALSLAAARKCLQKAGLVPTDIDCLVFVSSTGIATPSMDSRLVNSLGLRSDITRIPLWGLGCAGGAMGLSRSCEYAGAYPGRRVLLISVELCGLTFIRQDLSKSNLVATCLFGDGAAAVVVSGDHVQASAEEGAPRIQFRDARTTTWPDTLDVMGWELTEPGLKVIFSRDIPTLIQTYMRENVESFLTSHQTTVDRLRHFIFHPGGAKVLNAYQSSLGIDAEATRHSEEVLRHFGNMSSPTVLFVLEKSMEQAWQPGDRGLVAALGPGFSSELLLLEAR